MKEYLSIKKITALFLCLSLLFAFGACKDRGDEADDNNITATGPTQFTLAYDTADCFNPFKITGVLNKQLISLMHRCLYVCDSSYTSRRDMAVGEVITGSTVEVAIGENFFSDGTAVTAQDVAYSCDAAAESPLYSALLSHYSGCEVKNDYTVIINFDKEDPNLLATLTFPIVKYNSAESENPAIGCGRYAYVWSSSSPALQINKYFSEAAIPEDGEAADGSGETAGTTPVDIVLKGANSSDSIIPFVDSGEIDFYFSDLSGGDVAQTKAGTIPVYLNNLLYVGVNFSDGNLSSQAIRRAVSLAIDRRELSDSAIHGNARPASLPFNTSWAELLSTSVFSSTDDYADLSAAKELLGEYGIGLENEEGEIKTIQLNLIYPDSNSYMYATAKLIAACLEKVSVEVTVTGITSSEYLNTINSGEWDMYIGEVRIPDNMNISAFLSANGGASYGIDFSQLTCDGVYDSYLSGDAGLDEFLTVFEKEQPFIPLCFRNGRFFYTKKITNITSVTENNLFENIAYWSAG